MSFATGDGTCHCGRRTMIRTSWKDTNSGQRFQSCLNYELRCYNFFDWFDPPMCRRSEMIIPGLLKKMNESQVEIEILKLKNEDLVELNKKLKKIVCFSDCQVKIVSNFKVAKKNPNRMNQVKMLHSRLPLQLASVLLEHNGSRLCGRTEVRRDVAEGYSLRLQSVVHSRHGWRLSGLISKFSSDLDRSLNQRPRARLGSSDGDARVRRRKGLVRATSRSLPRPRLAAAACGGIQFPRAIGG
ncbi:GRF zinc finger containing protein [Striga asiatica]|uniref:GRF zinc finger containing protein n=1 Tax=Striga asiatica TaxID=4170 RepID=A0A5A7P5N5_STRAF|nr:GRF zinc finger containing protein [Striga asiatica]